MRLLTFLSPRFAWTSHSQTLPDGEADVAPAGDSAGGDGEGEVDREVDRAVEGAVEGATVDRAAEEGAGELRGEVRDAVVVFLHAERRDEAPEARARALRHVAKHVKWLAGKRGYRAVCLHSFTHLGSENAEPAFARAFLDELAARLEGAGYTVARTPFGWFSAWSLDVHGESLAKVWKEV